MKYDHFQQIRKDRWEELWVYRAYEGERNNLPLYALHAGYGVWNPGAAYVRKPSEVFSVELVTQGAIELVQRNRISRINAGEVFLLHKHVDHRYRAIGPGVTTKRYLCLDGPILEHLLHVLSLSGRDRIVPDSPQTVRSRFRRITRLLSNSDFHHAQQGGVAAYEILQHIAGSTRLEYPQQVEDAINYMYSHLDSKLTMGELSAAVGLSEPYLNRLFTRHVRSSPMKFFNCQKLSWTAHLLRYTSFSIKEIAFKAAFSDPLYFSAQFKHHFGVSPRSYRRSPTEHPESPQP